MSGVPGSKNSSDNSSVKKIVYTDFGHDELLGKLKSSQIENNNSLTAFRRTNPRYENHAIKIINKPGDIFIHLMLSDTSNTDTGHNQKIKNQLDGWKLHISVDESDPQNISKTWDIVSEIALKYKLNETKFLKGDKKLSPRQSGKEITIYIDEDDNPDLNWNDIIAELNQKLVEQNIQPGVRTFGDKPIRGSSFISYRFDDPNSEYKNSIEAGFQYLPLQKINDDPFQTVFVQENGQLSPKSRTEDIENLMQWYKQVYNDYGYTADINHIQLFVDKIEILDANVKMIHDQIAEIENNIALSSSSGDIVSYKQSREFKFQQLYKLSQELVSNVEAVENYFRRLDQIILLQDDHAAWEKELKEHQEISGNIKSPLNNLDEIYKNREIARLECSQVEQIFHTEPEETTLSPKELGEYFSDIENHLMTQSHYIDMLDEIINIKLSSSQAIAEIEEKIGNGEIDQERGMHCISTILEINTDLNSIYNNITELKKSPSETTTKRLEEELASIKLTSDRLSEVVSDLDKQPQEIFKEVHNKDIEATIREYQSPRFGAFR